MRHQKSDLHILHHALGISDRYAADRAPYRNRFVAGEGHADMPAIERLCADGLMRRTPCHAELTGGDALYTVTDEGRRLALATRPRLPRSKRRWRAYQNVRDAVPDLTFRQFLTDPEYAELR